MSVRFGPLLGPPRPGPRPVRWSSARNPGTGRSCHGRPPVFPPLWRDDKRSVLFLGAAEIGHGIYRANTAELRDRRRAFLDELKATVPIHPLTETTAEIVARIGGEQAARGIILPLADLPHRNLRPGTGLCGWEQQPAGFWQHPGFACDATVNDRAFFRRYRFLYTPDTHGSMGPFVAPFK